MTHACVRFRGIQFCLWLLLASTVIYSQASNAAAPSPDAAAAQGLQVLRALVDGGDLDLGFSSAAEVDQASIEHPLSLLTVGLADLATFRAGDDPQGLLRRSPIFLYLVTVRGTIRSSIRVESVDGGWEPSRVGNAALATALAQARESAFATSQFRDAFIVQVPSLNIVFLGRRISGSLEMVPVFDDADIELTAGTPISAAEVFARLIPRAQARNDAPG